MTQCIADGIWAIQEQLVALWLWEGSSGHHFLIKMSRICLSLLSSVFLPHTECSTLWWPVRDVTLQWNPSQRISPAALHLTVLCAFPVCFYDFTVSQHLYRMSASTFVCFIDCNLGCLTSWRFLYLNLKAKFEGIFCCLVLQAVCTWASLRCSSLRRATPQQWLEVSHPPPPWWGLGPWCLGWHCQMGATWACSRVRCLPTKDRTCTACSKDSGIWAR